MDIAKLKKDINAAREAACISKPAFCKVLGWNPSSYYRKVLGDGDITCGELSVIVGLLGWRVFVVRDDLSREIAEMVVEVVSRKLLDEGCRGGGAEEGKKLSKRKLPAPGWKGVKRADPTVSKMEIVTGTPFDMPTSQDLRDKLFEATRPIIDKHSEGKLSVILGPSVSVGMFTSDQKLSEDLPPPVEIFTPDHHYNGKTGHYSIAPPDSSPDTTPPELPDNSFGTRPDNQAFGGK